MEALGNCPVCPPPINPALLLVCLNCHPLGFVMGWDMDWPLLVCKQSVCIEPMSDM